VIDYILPIAATKKFGGTKAGVWGGIIGTIAGVIFLGPFGVIIGPLAGAIIGDLIGGNRMKSALKSGFGNFLGFVISTLMKIGLCIAMAVPIVGDIFQSVKGLITG